MVWFRGLLLLKLMRMRSGRKLKLSAGGTEERPGSHPRHQTTTPKLKRVLIFDWPYNKEI